MATEWKCIKQLGSVKTGEKTDVKLSVDSDGERAILNIRQYVNGTTPTKKGFSIDVENEELMTLVYNALGLMLDKPVKVAPPVLVPEPEKMSKNAKKRLARLGVSV
jgi:hypothetical protein